MRLSVKITPKAKINKVTKIDNYNYHIHTTSAPDKDKANQAIIKLLAEELKVPKSNITITQGAKSRKKIIQISQ